MIQKCAVGPRRARIEGALSYVSLNARRESKKEEERRHQVTRVNLSEADNGDSYQISAIITPKDDSPPSGD